MNSSGQKIYYFDHAAATPLDPEVLEAMMPYLTEHYANPSSLYAAARKSRTAVENARHSVASVLAAKVTEIVFTSGGTESDNVAIQGVLRHHPGSTWITTAIEHDAVLNQANALAPEGHNAQVIPVGSNGIVRPQDVADAVDDNTVLISVMYANNEVGTVQPLADITSRVATIRASRKRRGVQLPLYVHTDAVSAAPYLSLHVTRLGVDLLSLSGSKLYGPKGTGALYIRQGTGLNPLVLGGGQERGRRSGTENVAGIVGFAEALLRVQSQRDIQSRRLSLLRDALITQLLKAVPDATLNGDPTRRLPNNVNITIPGAEGEGLVLYLDRKGIMASTGSACTTGSLDPSHVLKALGLSDAAANASLRLTLGKSTDHAAIDAVASAIPDIARRLRQL